MDGTLLRELVAYQPENTEPSKQLLRDFLSSLQESSSEYVSDDTLSAEKALKLRTALENGQILFSLSKKDDDGIQVQFPRYQVQGNIDVSIHEKIHRLPLYIEGIVITIGENATLETLTNNFHASQALIMAYDRHTQIPSNSPYDTDGVKSLPIITEWFNKFLVGKERDGLPDFLQHKNPARNIGYFAYNEFIKGYNDIDPNSETDLKKLSCTVGRYTRNSAKLKHILLQNPTHHAFNE